MMIPHTFEVKFISGENAGRTFGRDSYWGNEYGRKHLEDHLLVGPTGRVFWKDHAGLQEITDRVELTWRAA